MPNRIKYNALYKMYLKIGEKEGCEINHSLLKILMLCIVYKLFHIARHISLLTPYKDDL